MRLQTEFFASRVLARGDLELVDIGIGLEIPTLVVTDAWRGVTGTRSRYGAYFGVVSTGIVCITHPCPSFAFLKLNGPRIGWLHSIDLQSSGATPEEIGRGHDALASGTGLIGFGRLRGISGPAGRGRELQTSEFYLKVEGSREPACGGFTYPPNPVCEAGEFCEQPAGSCYIADLPGTCQEIPEACITVFDPVCGCDGVTYGNDCERRRSQIALDHAGACGSQMD